MKTVFVLLVAFLALAGAQITQTQFMANVVISDPSISGTMSGTFYYSISGQMRIDYSIGVTVITDNVQKLSWKHCASVSCEATANNAPALLFIPDSGNFSASGNVYTSIYTSDFAYVNQIVVDPHTGNTLSATTSAGVVYTFTNYNTNFALSVFSAYQGWSCPTTTCNQPVDAVLVYDISGSIGASQWTAMVSFGQQFAGNFQFGNSATRMGLVWLGNDATAETTDGNGNPALYASQQAFINAVNLPRPQGAQSSCIGCGIRVGLQMLQMNARPGIPQIMLIVTDGQNNVPNVQRGCWHWITNDPNYGPYCDGCGGRPDGSGTNWLDEIPLYSGLYPNLTVFGVGTGVTPQDVQVGFMSEMSSNNDSYIYIGDFNDLQNSVNKITQRTCPATNTQSCNCNGGFCGCGGQCLCPSACKQTNCTSSSCTVPGLGCNPSLPITCPADACHTAGCSESGGGCFTTPIVCTSNDGCLKPTCDPVAGCGTTSNVTSCPNYNSCSFCTNGQCGNTPSCVCATKVCPSCTVCDPNSANCLPMNCNDNNNCTIDSCSNNVCVHTPVNVATFCTAGNQCQTAACDTPQGCTYTNFNVSIQCNDYNMCTNDTCNPSTGCVHTNITCTLANATACTDLTCNPLKGCPTTLEAIDCSKVGNLSLLLGDCHTLACNASTGCYLRLVEGQSLCKGQFCASSSLCQTIIGLTAGAIAGIAIGAAAGAAVIGAGGKVGFDYFSANAAAAGGVQNNPMYVANQSGGANPMYETGAA